MDFPIWRSACRLKPAAPRQAEAYGPRLEIAGSTCIASDAWNTLPIRNDVGPMHGWHHRGYIPHVDYPHLWQFVTFHLADSIPGGVIERWSRELGSLPGDERGRELRRLIDAYQDAGHGSCVLRDARCAEQVARQLFAGDGSAYRLAAWVVMPNHVHVMIGPCGEQRVDLSETTRRWKGASSRFINQIAGRRGALWRRESYDRWIRDSEHFTAVARYIAENPVKAGLCREPSEWRWSHAWNGNNDPRGAG